VSDRQPWRCKSCHMVLGEVVDGALRPTARVESVDRTGMTQVPCPRCKRVKTWFPNRPPHEQRAVQLSMRQ
jgi:hypothetical protein